MTPKFSHLSQEQRYQIEALKHAGHSQIFIARQLNVHKSTISRELRRNSIAKAKPPDKYQAAMAQQFAEYRAAYKPRNLKTKDDAILRRIRWLLRCGWSPEQIAYTCRHRAIAMLSTEGIYLWIYQQRKSGKEDLTPYLRIHHRKRRKRKLEKQPRVIIKNKTSIHDRPIIVAQQLRFGDMETDLVKCTNGYILTITERKSLFNFLVKIPNKEAETVKNAIIKTLIPFKHLIKTITSDNGTEFAKHTEIAKELHVPWFFADPYCSQQRGCNENQNGLLRQYLNRKTN
ncbi:MAG: IS30 family transposase, partial [Bacteroidetes bacterium]|nr:IS30 family transposase [Bacteroidota bacterium]